MRINEAILFAKLQGTQVTKRQISDLLWPNSTPSSRSTMMTNVCNGKAKMYSEHMINTVCELTGVDANFLFNINPMKQIFK